MVVQDENKKTSTGTGLLSLLNPIPVVHGGNKQDVRRLNLHPQWVSFHSLQHPRQHLARGSLEKAIQTEVQSHGLKAERQKEYEVFYFDKRVGYYRLDLLSDEKVIVELKAVPEILSLHQAQLISYLKGYHKQVGVLANFGSPSLQHQTFPNRLEQKNPLKDHFDYDKIKLKEKQKIKALLLMANRVLITLGAGYFPQIYRRALYYELKVARVNFGVIKEVTANYQDEVLGSREVNFFLLDDLLLSVVTVNRLDRLLLLKFRNYIKHLGCKRGLIFNFNSTVLDFRYFEIA